MVSGNININQNPENSSELAITSDSEAQVELKAIESQDVAVEHPVNNDWSFITKEMLDSTTLSYFCYCGDRTSLGNAF